MIAFESTFIRYRPMRPVVGLAAAAVAACSFCRRPVGLGQGSDQQVLAERRGGMVGRLRRGVEQRRRRAHIDTDPVATDRRSRSAGDRPVLRHRRPRRLAGGSGGKGAADRRARPGGCRSAPAADHLRRHARCGRRLRRLRFLCRRGREALPGAPRHSRPTASSATRPSPRSTCRRPCGSTSSPPI